MALQRVAGARARARRTVDLKRVVLVEAHDRDVVRNVTGVEKLADRHHVSGRVRDVDPREIGRRFALARFRLHQHLVRSRPVVEEVHQRHAGRRADRIEERLRRYAERQRLRAIELRRQVLPRQDRGNANLRERRILLRVGQNGIADPVERRQAEVIDVLDLDCKSAGRSQSRNRGRICRQRREAGDLRELGVELVLQRERGVLHAPSLGERFELDEHRRLVRAVVGKAEADAAGYRFDLRHREHHLLEPFHGRGRLIHGGLDRQRHQNVEQTLVLGGNKALRRYLEHHAEQDEAEHEDADDDLTARDQPWKQAFVPLRERAQTALEPQHEMILRQLAPVHDLVGKHGGEGQGRKERYRDRGGHRQRKLLVEQAGRAREQRHRNEDRHQHERGRQNRTGDFLHRADRRVEGARFIVNDVANDVLQHDDRVVNDEPGCQRQAEER